MWSLALQEPETISWQSMNSTHQLVVLVVLGNIAKIVCLQSLDWTGGLTLKIIFMKVTCL